MIGCLSADGDYDGAPVRVTDCSSSITDNMVWGVMPGGSANKLGVFQNKCLDVPGGVTSDGTKLQIWTCYEGNTNQLWQLTSGNMITWASHNKYVFLLCLSSWLRR
jgi:hypothetical protein